MDNGRVCFSLIRYRNGCYYFGTSAGGKHTGIGLMNHPSGDFYEGEWIENRFDGVGVHIKHLKHTYIGEFYNDLYDGIGRIVTSRYSFLGRFEEGMRAGVGELITRQGVRARGYFGNNKLHGYGEIYDPVELQMLRGYFRQGVLNGLAVKTSEDSKWIGVYAQGVLDGVSVHLSNSTNKVQSISTYRKNVQKGFCISYGDGEVYEGYMYDGAKQGYGKTKTSADIHIGYYDQNEKVGLGHIESGKFRYTGGFKMSRYEGIGYIKFPDTNESYFGGWKNGEKNGIGYEKIGGNEYLGGFRDGVKEGYAIVKIPNREEKCVFFKEGKLVGTAIEEDCRSIRDHKLNFKHFIETSNQRLKEISRDIDHESSALNIDYAQVEARLEEERKNFASQFEVLRNNFESVRDRFDLIRVNLGQKVKKSGLKYDNRFIHQDEADKMKAFTIQYEQLLSDFGRPYEIDQSQEDIYMKNGGMDQASISFDKDISHPDNFNLLNGNGRKPLSHRTPDKSNGHLGVEIPETRRERQKDSRVEDFNYEGFSNKKLEDIFCMRIEDMGVVGYDDYDPQGSSAYTFDTMYVQLIDDGSVDVEGKKRPQSIDDMMNYMDNETTNAPKFKIESNHRELKPDRRSPSYTRENEENRSSPRRNERSSNNKRYVLEADPSQSYNNKQKESHARPTLKPLDNVSKYMNMIDGIDIDTQHLVPTKPKNKSPGKVQPLVRPSGNDKLDWSLKEMKDNTLNNNNGATKQPSDDRSVEPFNISDPWNEGKVAEFRNDPSPVLPSLVVPQTLEAMPSSNKKRDGAEDDDLVFRRQATKDKAHQKEIIFDDDTSKNIMPDSSLNKKAPLVYGIQNNLNDSDDEGNQIGQKKASRQSLLISAEKQKKENEDQENLQEKNKESNQLDNNQKAGQPIKSPNNGPIDSLKKAEETKEHTNVHEQMGDESKSKQLDSKPKDIKNDHTSPNNIDSPEKSKESVDSNSQTDSNLNQLQKTDNKDEKSKIIDNQQEIKDLQEERFNLERLKVQLEIEMMKMQLENVKLEKEIYEKKPEEKK